MTVAAAKTKLWRQANRQHALRLNVSVHERKQEKLRALKTGPCADCKQVYDPVCMDFDHLPGHKKVAPVSTLAGSTDWAAVIEEIKKCELVCSNCHRLRSRARTLEKRARKLAEYGPPPGPVCRQCGAPRRKWKHFCDACSTPRAREDVE